MRWLGALLLTAAGLMGGLSAAAQLRRQQRELEELVLAMELLALELEAFRAPLPELAQRLARSAVGAGGGLFSRLQSRMTELPERSFPALWQEALAPLSAPARQCLEPLGGVLGRFGAAEQARAVRHSRELLGLWAARAAEKSRRNGRLYVGMGTCAGAVLSVMLL